MCEASSSVSSPPKSPPRHLPEFPVSALDCQTILCVTVSFSPPVILAPNTRSLSLSLSPELVFQFTTINSLPTKHSLIFYFQKLFFFFPILATFDHVSFEDFPYKNVFLHLVISIIGSNKGWLLTGPSSRVFSYWEYKRTTGSSGSASAWTLHGKLSLFRLNP